MRFRILLLACLWAWAGGVGTWAADARPTVGPGATKYEVIDAYGWPNGQSKSGAKEILSYAQGQVILENGRVDRVDFSPNVPWQAPKPRPGAAAAAAAAAKAKKGERPVDFWLSNLDDATREAVRRQARVLVLFTGSDWSPASKQFHDEVESHPDFVNAFTADFVFLRLDFASRSTLPLEVREVNNRLRERYGVTTYPTLLVLSTAGNIVAVVDLLKPQPGDTYRERVIAAVREVRDLLRLQPPENTPASPSGAAAGPAAPSGGTPSLEAITFAATLRKMGRALTSAAGMGTLFVVVMFWLVWRRWSAPPSPVPAAALSSRISDAAGGLPTQADLKTWTRQKVCAVVAGLAEADGYVAEIKPVGGDYDIALLRAGETKPRIVVCCSPGTAGVVSAKPVRELFGTLAAVGVEVGWYVSPVSFASDARHYAAQNNLMLVDGERILGQLRDLPPLVLPKVLMRR